MSSAARTRRLRRKLRHGRNRSAGSYVFDLMDPILGLTGKVEENNRLYCSEFVWRSYVKGARVRIVEEGAFFNLLSDENRERTIDVLVSLKDKWYTPEFMVRNDITRITRN